MFARTSVRVAALALVILAGIIGVLSLRNTEAAPNGPQLSVNGPAAVAQNGTFAVNFAISGAGFDEYAGYQTIITYDPTLVQAQSFANQLSNTFVAPTAIDNTAPGGSIQGGAVLLGETSDFTGTAAIINFQAQAVNACAQLTLEQHTGDPTEATGSFTINGDDNTAQTNTYGSVQVDIAIGTGSCAPVATPTASPVTTLSPTATFTETPSPTATPTVTPIPGQPDVTISKSSNPASVIGGQSHSYVVKVLNLGDAAAQNVVVTDVLPAGAVFKPSGSCLLATGGAVCTTASLAANDNSAGGPDERTFIVNVQAPYSTSDRSVSNQVSVAAANEPAPNTGNNTASATTQIAGCPDLNGDNAINILDMSAISAQLGKASGDPGYNPFADMNGDDVINIFDLSVVASRFAGACVGLDSDSDGLPDFDENGLGTNKFDSDTDGDGLLDGVEAITTGTPPLDPDADDDGLSDGDELLVAQSDPFDPDTDLDGLLDGEEFNTYGTNPLLADTDGDHCSDRGEALDLATWPGKDFSLDPLDPFDWHDVNGDGVINIFDLSLVVSSFAKGPGDPGYLGGADRNGDTFVNLFDLARVARQFGGSCLGL